MITSTTGTSQRRRAAALRVWADPDTRARALARRCEGVVAAEVRRNVAHAPALIALIEQVRLEVEAL